MDRKTAQAKARALVGQMTLREKASQLRFDSPAIERLGIPAYNWWNEALHGVARGGTATSFPQAIGLAAMFDDVLVEKLGDTAATEGRAPTVKIPISPPAWGRPMSADCRASVTISKVPPVPSTLPYTAARRRCATSSML